jgi:hypothetical protein
LERLRCTCATYTAHERACQAIKARLNANKSKRKFGSFLGTLKSLEQILAGRFVGDSHTTQLLREKPRAYAL